MDIRVKNHVHPLETETLCCPQHVLEICQVLDGQDNDSYVIDTLLRFSRAFTTEFLLEKDGETTALKRLLVEFICKYSILVTTQGDFSAAKKLLNMATILTGKLRELLSSKVTVLVNSAFLKRKMDEPDQALAFLERAEMIAGKTSEKLDLATVRVNKAAVLRTLGLDYRALAELEETAAMLEPLVSRARGSDDELKRISSFKKTVSMLITCNTERLKMLGDSLNSDAQSIWRNTLELAERFLRPGHVLAVKLKSLDALSRSQSSSSGNKSKTKSSMSLESAEEYKMIVAVPERNRDAKKSSIKVNEPKPMINSDFFERRRRSKLGFVSLPPGTSVHNSDVLSKSMIQHDSDSSPRSVAKDDDHILNRSDASIRSQSSNSSSVKRLENTKKKLPKLKLEKTVSADKSVKRNRSQIVFKSKPSFDAKINKVNVSPTIDELSPVRYQFFPEDEVKDYTYLIDPQLNYLNLTENENVYQVIAVDGSLYLLKVVLDVAGQAISIEAESLNKSSGEICPERVQFSEFGSIINMLKIEAVLPNNMIPRFIDSFRALANYVILPFVQLRETKSSIRVEIWENSRSLMGPIEFIFLKKKWVAELFAVEGFRLRLVLTRAPDDLKSVVLILDIELDEFSSKLLLKPIEAQIKGDPSKFNPAYKPIDPKNFKLFIGAIRLFEKHYEGQENFKTFGDAVTSSHVVTAKAVLSGPGFVTCLWVLSDRRDISAWEVYLYKNEMKLCYDYSYDLIMFHFGLRIDRLPAEERKFLACLLLDTIYLELKDGRPVISTLPIEEGPQFEFQLDPQSKVRMCLIGYKHTIIGVKATQTYKHFSSQYGVLFLLGHLNNPRPQTRPQISFAEYINCFTSLPGILASSGWEKLRQALRCDRSTNELHLLDARGKTVYIEPFKSSL